MEPCRGSPRSPTKKNLNMDPKNKLTIDDSPKVQAPAPLEDFQITEPDLEEVQEAVERLDSFREYQKELRGDSLTFGDY